MLPRPRVGFITPSLHLGGAEIWICVLLTQLDRQLLDVAGVATTSAANDPAFMAVCRQVAPVFEGSDSVSCLAAVADAVRQAISRANRPTVERARAITAERFTTDVMARRWTKYLLHVAFG